MLVTHIFLLFFHNSFFLDDRNSDLESSLSNWTSARRVNLVGACGP